MVLCLTVEVVLIKKTFLINRRVAVAAVGFFINITYIWLFLPQFLRCKVDERALQLQEYAALGEFVKSSTITRAFVF
jgi:hypothetical protein